MKKLFVGALAVAGATLLLAIFAPGLYNDVVNAGADVIEWLKTR